MNNKKKIISLISSSNRLDLFQMHSIAVGRPIYYDIHGCREGSLKDFTIEFSKRFGAPKVISIKTLGKKVSRLFLREAYGDKLFGMESDAYYMKGSVLSINALEQLIIHTMYVKEVEFLGILKKGKYPKSIAVKKCGRTKHYYLKSRFIKKIPDKKFLEKRSLFTTAVDHGSFKLEEIKDTKKPILVSLSY